MHMNNYDLIIMGGGIIGCAVAYYLITKDSKLNIAVIEKDSSYSLASTTLSMANIRVQFSLKENILISKYAIECFETFKENMAVEGIEPEIDFRQEGNLFLINEENERMAHEAFHLQKKLHCRVEWWGAEVIKKRFALYKPFQFFAGTFGAHDGYLDPYAMLMAYRRKSSSLGVTYINSEVVDISRNNHGITGVKLISGDQINTRIVINCAGAWAASLSEMAGVSIPVQPRKRQVFVVDPAIKMKEPLPLTILPSGLYFRTETGGKILVGKSMDEDPIQYDFSWEQERFYDELWPELAEFVPAFDRLKLIRGWSGLYAENAFDGNAFLGEWPELKGFYLANGFSGHGLQQAPAVGRYISELILGQKPILDLSIFSPRRYLDKKPISENVLV